jgi:hypothetical protein
MKFNIKESMVISPNNTQIVLALARVYKKSILNVGICEGPLNILTTLLKFNFEKHLQLAKNYTIMAIVMKILKVIMVLDPYVALWYQDINTLIIQMDTLDFGICTIL